MLTALLRTMDLGVDARQALTDEQIVQVSRWRTHGGDGIPARIARTEAKRLAFAILQFHGLLATNHQQLKDIVDTLAPGLLDLSGVGPVSAAQVLVSYSHHGRVRSEAAFAALAGVNPSRHLQATSSVIDSTGMATGSSTKRSTPSRDQGWSSTPPPSRTLNGGPQRVKPFAKSAAASNDSSPDNSSGNSEHS